MPENPSVKRVAYSPAEFAELFGKSQTWGYRQIYSGKVSAITQHGRILIPSKDVEKILASAGIYNGVEKPKKAQERVASFTPEQSSIWERFLKLRHQGKSPAKLPAKASSKKGNWKSAPKKEIRTRVLKSWSHNTSKT